MSLTDQTQPERRASYDRPGGDVCVEGQRWEGGKVTRVVKDTEGAVSDRRGDS